MPMCGPKRAGHALTGREWGRAKGGDEPLPYGSNHVSVGAALYSRPADAPYCRWKRAATRPWLYCCEAEWTSVHGAAAIQAWRRSEAKCTDVRSAMHVSTDNRPSRQAERITSRAAWHSGRRLRRGPGNPGQPDAVSVRTCRRSDAGSFRVMKREERSAEAAEPP